MFELVIVAYTFIERVTTPSKSETSQYAAMVTQPVIARMGTFKDAETCSKAANDAMQALSSVSTPFLHSTAMCLRTGQPEDPR
jgi:hypothetical protein